MRTIDEITMRADADAIYRAAADVEHWPDFLPHYRWVKVIERTGDGTLVEMAARRGWIPVRWQAVQTVDPAKRRIYYHHTGGATKGMDVVWQIEPCSAGMRVAIIHELNLQQPFVRTWLGKLIVGHIFVRYIAGRTLQCMKDFSERGGHDACAVQSSQESGQ